MSNKEWTQDCLRSTIFFTTYSWRTGPISSSIDLKPKRPHWRKFELYNDDALSRWSSTTWSRIEDCHTAPEYIAQLTGSDEDSIRIQLIDTCMETNKALLWLHWQYMSVILTHVRGFRGEHWTTDAYDWRGSRGRQCLYLCNSKPKKAMKILSRSIKTDTMRASMMCW